MFYGKRRGVYRKKRAYRKGARRGNYWGRGGRSVAALASQAMRGVNYIKGLVNSEMFKYDVTYGVNNITNSWTISALTNIAQGDTDVTRTGNSIFLRSIQGKLSAARSTSGDVVQAVCVCVFADTQQTSDTAPVGTDVFSASTPYAHLNEATVGRYQILYRRILLLDTVGNLGKMLPINIPLRHHVRYNGTASTDIQKGGVYLAYIGTQATSSYPTLSGELRMSYHDN